MTTTIRTPHGNVPVTHYVPGGLQHINYRGGKISMKYTFTVVMKDDSAFTSRTRIDHASGPHTLTVKDGSKTKVKINRLSREKYRAYWLGHFTRYGSDECSV